VYAAPLTELGSKAVGDITTGHRGRKADAVGYASNLVIGIASTAPAYSLAATLGFIVVVDGVGMHSPAILIVSLVPIFLVAFSYRYPKLLLGNPFKVVCAVKPREYDSRRTEVAPRGLLGSPFEVAGSHL
jgi:hypothetical protein